MGGYFENWKLSRGLSIWHPVSLLDIIAKKNILYFF